MSKSELVQVEGMNKGRERPNITIVEVVKNDMSIKKVIESMTLDRTKWHKRTRGWPWLGCWGSIAEPKALGLRLFVVVASVLPKKSHSLM